jgi:hypothetical protein
MTEQYRSDEDRPPRATLTPHEDHLGQDLCDDPATRRTQRHPGGKLLAPGENPCPTNPDTLHLLFRSMNDLASLGP